MTRSSEASRSLFDDRDRSGKSQPAPIALRLADSAFGSRPAVASTLVRPEGVGSPEAAEAADAGELLALREAAASWLASRGIRQWDSGEVAVEEVRDQIEAGQWHVVRENGAPVAALRLLWQDEQVWGPQPPDAAYVHGLVVSQQHHSLGMGSALLRWAAGQARARGRSLLRLDCGEENEALRRYYLMQGFAEVGRRDSDGRWYSVVLLEQRLSGGSGALCSP